MIYGKYAKRFKDANLVVTPLLGKAPIIKDWEATTTETVYLEEIYITEKGKKVNTYKCNMGLLTGKPSGVICADIDCDDDGLTEKLYKLMPETPVMKKGKKGINFFYRWKDENTIKIHNPINKRKVEFELISTGRQTVIPTSIHPESKMPYIWCDRKGNRSNNNLLNVAIDKIPYLDASTIDAVKKCIEDHFAEQKQEIADNKQAAGVAGLITNFDKIGHKDLSDYNPKNKRDIPEGYRDRCRSGSHDAIVSFMMALINKGYAKEHVITEAMKYDQDYNLGYANVYFTCRTNKARGETAWQRAEYYYESSYKTVSEKKAQAGEVMPVESDIVVQNDLKEMDAVNRILNDHGISYEKGFLKLEEDKKDKFIIIKESEEFFIYHNKKWNMTEDAFKDKIYRKFNNLLGLKKSHNQITAAFNKFTKFVPNTPRNMSMFEQRNHLLQVANGTLEYTGKTVKLREHDKWDLCTHLTDINYNPNAKNKMFTDWLEKVCDGDKEMYYAIQEMFGQALFPVFARVWMMYGVSGSGKSTLGKIINMMLGMDLFSSVPPNDFDRFGMESMINKRINMDLDISVAKPISDGAFKKIEDAQPQRIQRKGRRDLYAHTPNCHIFGTNTLPKNFDAISGAYDRRMTIIKFTKSFTSNGKKYDRDYARKMFGHCPEGILNFAIEGVKRLIANEWVFTIPQGGKEAMEEWNLESDPVGLFLRDIELNEVSGIDKDPCIDPNQMINRGDLWKIFDKWKDEVGRNYSKITRNKFYKIVEEKGYSQRRSSTERMFKGIGYVKDTTSIEASDSADYSGY